MRIRKLVARTLVAAFMLAIGVVGAFGATPPAPVRPQLSVVFQLNRPQQGDVLVLPNGQQLAGTVVNKTFTIRTAYGTLTLPKGVVAGIDLDGGTTELQTVITVNGSRLTGFVEDPNVKVKLPAGPEIELRREKVSKIVFQILAGERQALPHTQLITMKNGDYFTARLLATSYSIDTPAGRVTIKPAEARGIMFNPGKTATAKAFLLNQAVVDGELENDDVQMQLDIGPHVTVYKDRIDRILFEDGKYDTVAWGGAPAPTVASTTAPTAAAVAQPPAAPAPKPAPATPTMASTTAPAVVSSTTVPAPAAPAQPAAPKPRTNSPMAKLPAVESIYEFGSSPKDGMGKSGGFELANTSFSDGALDLNGVYGRDANGYSALLRVPTLNYKNLTVGVQFRFRSVTKEGTSNILTGGASYRWLGISRAASGNLAVMLNNFKTEHEFPNTPLPIGQWHSVLCSLDVDHRYVEVYLNGKALPRVALPQDFVLDVIGSNAEKHDRILTFTNMSNGATIDGHVDNLTVFERVLNPTEMAQAAAVLHSAPHK